MTKPEVFIIESLNLEDEEESIFEGKFLFQILHLGGKTPLYYYIRTKKELEEILKIYNESNYRYLHISCHGNATSVRTTFDEIKFQEFANLINPYLKEKRLFLSACSVVNNKLAKLIIPPSKCYSIIGPEKDIRFDDAAIVWATFYHLIFKENPKKMAGRGVLLILRKVKKTFDIPINYFAISKSKGYRKRSV